MSDKSPQENKSPWISQLFQACQHGNLEQIRRLVREQKYNPIVRNDDGATALHIACQCGHIDILLMS